MNLESDSDTNKFSKYDGFRTWEKEEKSDNIWIQIASNPYSRMQQQQHLTTLYRQKFLQMPLANISSHQQLLKRNYNVNKHTHLLCWLFMKFAHRDNFTNSFKIFEKYHTIYESFKIKNFSLRL